ncbi:MAG TPA: hypothetical protein VMF68_12085 [Spirochaetia bacterium]|nr:hypothetical protein [Spirochaetia bacterium]
MPSRIAIALMVLATLSVPAFAADAPAGPSTSQYSLGDQTMSINAGLFLPLFDLPSGVIFLSGSPPQLTPGAVGSLSWAAYVSPQIRVGIDIAGNFTLDPNSNVLLMLPFVAKASYIFSFYPFELPVTFGLGANIVKYTSLSTLDLLLRPGVGLYWIYNSSWSFGANLNYWFDMQFNTTAANSRYGSFLEFSLSALYHF